MKAFEAYEKKNKSKYEGSDFAGYFWRAQREGWKAALEWVKEQWLPFICSECEKMIGYGIPECIIEKELEENE